MLCVRVRARTREREREELALFYRKGLIALPITDNATINDLREVGLGRMEAGKGEMGGKGEWELGGWRSGRGREWE